MANTAQAKKRARQAEVHRARNAGQRTELRTQIKKVRTAVVAKDKSAAQQAFRAIVESLSSPIEHQRLGAASNPS